MMKSSSFIFHLGHALWIGHLLANSVIEWPTPFVPNLNHAAVIIISSTLVAIHWLKISGQPALRPNQEILCDTGFQQNLHTYFSAEYLVSPIPNPASIRKIRATNLNEQLSKKTLRGDLFFQYASFPAIQRAMALMICILLFVVAVGKPILNEPKLQMHPALVDAVWYLFTGFWVYAFSIFIFLILWRIK